jgi:PEP-CTERM motif
MKLQPLSFIAVFMTLGITCASAATITSYNRAAFQTALSGGTVSGQNFDSLANGATLGTLNGVTYGASAGTPIVTNAFLTTTSPNGLGSTSLGFFGNTESASFTFATAITAFAIDVNTFAPTAGDYSATLNLGDVVLSKFDVFPGSATGQFIGFISNTPFTSVTISTRLDPNNSRYSYTLDSLVYGNAAAVVSASAPEPSTFGIMGTGLAVFALALRRRRQN